MLHIGNQTVELESVKEAKEMAAKKKEAQEEEKKDEVMIDTANKEKGKENEAATANGKPAAKANEPLLAELYKPKCTCGGDPKKKCINCLEKTSG